jgi:cytochrome b subunit of formate dehydrogenase
MARAGISKTKCHFCLSIIILCVIILLNGHPSLAKDTTEIYANCLDCHDDYLLTTQYPESVHGNLGCASCHADFKNIEKHMAGEQKPELLSCGTCHKEIAEEYKHNYHYLHQNFQCYDCHKNIHEIKRRKTFLKKAVLDSCTECHSNEEYAHSGHGISVATGNQDAATCSDCHGLHNTRVYHTSGELYPDEAREFYSRTCVRCHGDKKMMERNGLFPSAVDFYDRTYHGKVQHIGYPTRVAGCADCHSSHNILPKDDPRSTIHPANLIDNCGKCHSGFHPRFVEYRAHPDFSNRTRYPALFWTYVFMVALLVVTFLFFWIHTFLWWRKTYWDEHNMEKLGIKPRSPFPEEVGTRSIQRFSAKEIFAHVVLVLSFFTLVLTGFPLKYHDAPWAKDIIRIWGGVHTAGIFHRIAAIILFALFFYVLFRSLRYLFSRGSGMKDVRERLFSPDSLFPNRKDWENLKGMFRWFFDRGEKPKFDRWSYWEKFDFLAVFWGMAVIGGTGIFLMVPEWTSYLFPGWVLNVASLLHSEEALLAALFIFTVHFFNTHLIPKKFPMDRTIFTGRLTIDELFEEKPDEYKRLIKEGTLDELKSEHPGILTKLLAAAFGFASLLLGLFLFGLIVWTLIFM